MNSLHRPIPIPRILLTALSAMVLCLSSCHSQKGSSYIGNLSDIAYTESDPQTMIMQLAESYEPWSDLYVPVEVALVSPKQLSISGRATMIYGEQINISLRMLGMEVAIIYIDTEKVYVIDKFHKVYFRESISDLLKGYDLSLVDLQNLLLGRAVIPGQGLITVDDADAFGYLSSDTEWLLTPKQRFDDVDWHYIASKTTPPLLQALSMRIKGAGAIECRYTEPTSTEAGIVDGIATITVPYKDSEIQVAFTWRLNDAKWNSGREIKFSAPGSSYKRLDIESLLHSLQSD